MISLVCPFFLLKATFYYSSSDAFLSVSHSKVGSSRASRSLSGDCQGFLEIPMYHNLEEISPPT